ncbi:MAG: alpha-hydroxy acid oxidase [Pigmentiphaga sp.]|uniref:alpha-hydroxy acid oxidase n=1 Tax=unclassified Pigmentiphaga TaxID=2626614 RepID=UPI0030CFDA12
MARLDRTFALDDFEALAKRRLPGPIFDFYAGGADDEHTLALNRNAFRQVGWSPRALAGGASPDASTLLLGRAVAMPVAVAPMGAVGYGCLDGDRAIARAAAQAGIPYILSTTATTTIEAIGEASAGAKWFQLYPLRQRDHMWRLLARALAAGFEALVVTVDVPVGGKRERDLRNDCAMPFRFTARNVAAFAARPRWALGMLRHGVPAMANLAGLDPAGARGSTLAPSVGAEFDPAFDWSGLAEIRRRWPGPLLVKGVLRPDDALRALRAGCDGLVVSNHGGRQLETGVPALAALAAVLRAVGDKAQVFLDGGVRRGADVAKARCLGAAGVLVGRPLLFGACVAGQAGAARVLDILHDELIRTMRLCGAANAAALTSELLWNAGIPAAPPNGQPPPT